MKPVRPKSVTVISWFLLVLCAINTISIAIGFWQKVATVMFKGPQSGPVALVGLGITVLCAFFMLRGANWARWLYHGWVTLGVIAMLFLSSSLLMLVPGALKTAVFAYFLTRDDANAFFAPTVASSKESGHAA